MTQQQQQQHQLQQQQQHQRQPGLLKVLLLLLLLQLLLPSLQLAGAELPGSGSQGTEVSSSPAAAAANAAAPAAAAANAAAPAPANAAAAAPAPAASAAQNAGAAANAAAGEAAASAAAPSNKTLQDDVSSHTNSNIVTSNAPALSSEQMEKLLKLIQGLPPQQQQLALQLQQQKQQQQQQQQLPDQGQQQQLPEQQQLSTKQQQMQRLRSALQGMLRAMPQGQQQQEESIAAAAAPTAAPTAAQPDTSRLKAALQLAGSAFKGHPLTFAAFDGPAEPRVPVGVEAAQEPQDTNSQQLANLPLSSDSVASSTTTNILQKRCNELVQQLDTPATQISFDSLKKWVGAPEAPLRLHRFSLKFSELGPLTLHQPSPLQAQPPAEYPLVSFYVTLESPLRAANVLLFTTGNSSSECKVQRDVSATGSVFTYISLKEAMVLDGLLSDSRNKLLFLNVTCDKPCKPHVSVHLNGADERPNEIQCSRMDGGGPLACGAIAGRGSRRFPSHFIFRCTRGNGCFEGLKPGERDMLELTLSQKQQGSLKDEGNVSSFVLLAAWDCVPQTPTDEETDATKETVADAQQCETINTKGSVGSTLYLTTTAKSDGVLHILVLVKTSPKASHDFSLTLEAPNAITPISMEQPIDVIMPPNSLRYFAFRFEDTPFDASQYCFDVKASQRDSKDTYHPFLVAAYALDGEPPSISCCNASRQKQPDPALSTKKQPDCWRANEAEWNGLVVLRVRSDYRREQAPYGDFVCGVRTREKSHSLFRLSVSSQSSRQDPRHFGLVEVDSVAVVNLVPFTYTCQYEHVAFKTDWSGVPITLKLHRQEGPLPSETCVFPCQSAEMPLATCSGLPLPGVTPPEALCISADQEDQTKLLPLPLLPPNHFYVIRFKTFQGTGSTLSILLHKRTPSDVHVSSVSLRNGVPFFGRLHGDWEDGRAFQVVGADTRPAFSAPPLYSEGKEIGDLACLLEVTKEHLQDLEGLNRPIGFQLNVVTSDALTDVLVFSPSSKSSFAYEAKRLSPVSVFIAITTKATKETDWIDPKHAEGTWKIVLNTSAKASPVSVQVTAAVGPVMDGSIQAYRHPKLQTLESQAQHLMDGGHFVDYISADPNASNHRKVFIFPLNFDLKLAGGVGFDSAMRCAATRFGSTSVRLFANAVTWEEGQKPPAFRAFSADEYRLPLPEDPDSVFWPASSSASGFPSLAYLEMEENGAVDAGLEAAYVIVAEGYNATHAAVVQPTSTQTSPVVPVATTTAAAAAGAAGAGAADPNADKFSIMCSFTQHAIPLAVGEGVEGFLKAEEEHLYALTILDNSQDVALALRAGLIGDADMYVGIRRDVSARHPQSVLFSCAGVGDEYLYLSHGSAPYKEHCNEKVLESHGACTFYILITASVPSKYTLTADLQASDVTFLPVGHRFSGFLEPKKHKTFVVSDIKPRYDYELTVTAEAGADAYVALQRAENLENLTPLSEGSAQWWTDGLSSPSVYIQHTKLALRGNDIECVLASDSSSQTTNNGTATAAATATGTATKDKQQPTVLPDKLNPATCILRIDVESATVQPFSLVLEGQSSNAIPVTTLVSGASMRGILAHQTSNHFRIDIEPKLLEGDPDATLRISLEGKSCSPWLSVRWPDGGVKVWSYPNSREVVIDRKTKEWKPGFFLLLVHDPSLEASFHCPYELLARIEPSASEALNVRVLRTGIPKRGTIKAGVPERFVWSTVTGHAGKSVGSDLIVLRAAAIRHSIDVYATRLEPGQGFPEQPKPGDDPPPGVFKLLPYEDDPNTVYLRLGNSWGLLGAEEFESVCKPTRLSEAGRRKKEDKDEQGPLQVLDRCQLLISVFDKHAQELDAPRDVDFSVVVVSHLRDYFIQCAFEEPIDLAREMFLRSDGVKVMLLPLENGSADISLRFTSSAPSLIKEMTAWLDFDERLLQDPSPYSRLYCVLPDHSELCWKGKTYIVGSQGVTEINIRAERKAVHLRRLLYVIIRVETNKKLDHEPLLQFVARQQFIFTPLRDNHDEAVYSVDNTRPKFFSFETSYGGGYLILTLGVDLRSLAAQDSHGLKETAQELIQSLNVYVQSCNTETFVKSMWSENFRPSASLSTDKAFVNEYNQLVAIVENNLHQCSSPICQYRAGVYSSSTTPVFFRFTASLQHQGTALVLPLGEPMLGHVNRKPQIQMGSPGTEARMIIADYIAARVWKPTSKAEKFLLSVQACSGGVGYSWGTNRVRVRSDAETSRYFVGSLKFIDRLFTEETLAMQGLLSRVIDASDLTYIGVSIKPTVRHQARGFVGGKQSSFSIRVDALDSAVCLGAANVDVHWTLRSATWFPSIWGEKPKTMVADVSWSPLMAAPAMATVGKGRISSSWACAAPNVAASGSALPADSVVYELFIAKTNAVHGNWLASCGMYQDAFFNGVAKKITIPEGSLSYSMNLEFDGTNGYRIGLVAKHITKGSTSLAQPFAYRFSEIPPDANSQSFNPFTLSSVFWLIVIAVIVTLICKFFRRGGSFFKVFQRLFSSNQIKRFTGLGSALTSSGLELTHTRPSAYGPVPTTIGCVDDGPLHEGDPVDIGTRAVEIPDMAGTPWLSRDRS